MSEGNGRSGEIGKAHVRAELPKRFYTTVAVAPGEGGFAVLLDGRSVRTPGKKALSFPARDLAEAVAEEWRAQVSVIDPARMPLTRIANSAIDGVAERMEEVADDIAAHAASDLLSYRAEAPVELRARQAAAWDPLVAWANRTFGISLEVVDGVMPVAQSPDVRRAVRDALAGRGPLALAALHVLTTISGSALLALAVEEGRLAPAEAWAAAHVDEDWQIEHWGEDAEAARRREQRRLEFMAAAQLLASTDC